MRCKHFAQKMRWNIGMCFKMDICISISAENKNVISLISNLFPYFWNYIQFTLVNRKLLIKSSHSNNEKIALISFNIKIIECIAPKKFFAELFPQTTVFDSWSIRKFTIRSWTNILRYFTCQYRMPCFASLSAVSFHHGHSLMVLLT